MATITLRTTDEDAELIRDYASFHSMTVSQFARDSMMQTIEDEHDIAALRQAIRNDDGVRYSLDEVRAELGM